MLIYVIKLIHPATKEVYYERSGKRPEFPSQQTMDAYQGAILIISTTNSILPESKEKK
jgi:hypothetical protein